MITLINTLISEKGELFAVGHGRRALLARCRPEIRIYEKVRAVPVLGAVGYREKTLRLTVALCGDMEFTHDVEASKQVERYELTADLLRNDGIVERFYFHNILLTEINPAGEWEFELNVTDEQMKKLLVIAGAKY